MSTLVRPGHDVNHEHSQGTLHSRSHLYGQSGDQIEEAGTGHPGS